MVGDRAVIECVDLQEPVIGADKSVFMRCRSGAIDDRANRDPGLLEAPEDEILHLVLAEDGRERHVRPRRCEMLGYDRRATDEILAAVEPHARGRRLGHAADHRRMGQAVDDGVADDMDGNAAEFTENLVQALEVDPIGVHQHQQLVDRNVGRPRFDQSGGRVDDIARRK
jgi:hypothetical protein